MTDQKQKHPFAKYKVAKLLREQLFERRQAQQMLKEADQKPIKIILCVINTLHDDIIQNSNYYYLTIYNFSYS